MDPHLQNKNGAQVNHTVQKILLFSGILSSLLYIIANIVCALQYEGYNTASQTVSELSAIGAPTRQLWNGLMLGYSALVLAFGVGIWLQANGDRRLRIMGILFIANTVIGFFWPPMHRREVLAAGGGTLTDTLHIVFTFITVPIMMLIIGYGATVSGKRFRFYSVITIIILVLAGIITAIDGPKISAGLPTPWVGVWERINIGVYMLWVAMLAVNLMRKLMRKKMEPGHFTTIYTVKKHTSYAKH